VHQRLPARPQRVAVVDLGENKERFFMESRAEHFAASLLSSPYVKTSISRTFVIGEPVFTEHFHQRRCEGICIYISILECLEIENRGRSLVVEHHSVVNFHVVANQNMFHNYERALEVPLQFVGSVTERIDINDAESECRLEFECDSEPIEHSRRFSRTRCLPS
jgi:hypothetical protein